MRIFLILLLAASLVFVSLRLADVERQRYALMLELCPTVMSTPDAWECLETVRPRVSVWFDFYYGLSN